MTWYSGYSIPAVLTGLVLVSPVQVLAEAGPTRAEDSTRDARYDCPAPAPAEAAKRASELTSAQWDKNKLACGSDILFKLANESPRNASLQVQSLLAATAYIDHVNTLWNYDLYGIRVPEWTARIQHVMQQGKVVDTRLAALPAQNADVLAARALYKLTWSAKMADTRTQLSEWRAAMHLLDQAVKLDPKALEGNALWLLGRLYYDLPEFAGGDSAKALTLLQDAYRQSPQNPSLLRYEAYVYLQERDVALAKERLEGLLSVSPAPGGLQTLADELKGGQELATRAADTTLTRKLADKRDALLKANPQLLARLPTAANMHGGVDPITGKEY